MTTTQKYKCARCGEQFETPLQFCPSCYSVVIAPAAEFQLSRDSDVYIDGGINDNAHDAGD